MNVLPKTMFTGDNLPVMRGMDSDSVDLIYLDPPFNSKKQWSAPIGSKAAGAAFKDAWTFDDVDKADLGIMAEDRPNLANLINAVGDVNGKPDKAYLLMMASRLIEIHRILKPTGSIYLHCDPVMSHSLKLVLDEIFGKENFNNEILWLYKTGGMSKRWFGRKHDVILFYGKTNDYIFNPQKEKSYLTHKYGFSNVQIHNDKNGPYTVVGMRDFWDIPALRGNQPESVGYPTQKPLALLNRIIRASTNEGDLVLDPFCGCATACVAAEDLNRNWIGIDISEKAIQLVKQRFNDELGLFNPNINDRSDFPIRSDKVVRSKKIKHTLYGEQEGYCNGCKHHYPYHGLAVDHIIPTSKGGPNDDSNLQLLCSSCNSTKGDKSMAHLISRLQELGRIR